MIDRRNRVLPDQFFLRHQRAEVTSTRAHVAVGQFEPGAGKGISEFLRVLVETARNLLVSRVHAQRHIRSGHHRWVFLRRVVGIRDQVLGFDVFRCPLMGTGRALGQFPLVTEEHVEIAVIPSGGVWFPSPFDTTGGGVDAFASAELVDPAQALLFQRRGFRLWANQGRITGAVGFTEGVTAGYQRHGFFVVHRHAGEGFAHIAARCQWVRITVRTFRVNVDQAHLHGGQRVFQLAITGVAAVRFVAGGQPLGFRTPVGVFFRLPDVRTAAGKAEGFEAHGFQRNVTSQNEQVSPGQFAAVLLLDWPQQATGFVQVAVIRPAVERRKALIAGARTATAIVDAVGAGCVPGHTDHQTTVMPPVGWPPVLRIGHQRSEVFNNGMQIKRLEFLGVIEAFAHGVGLGGMLMKNFQAELVRPPVGILWGATRHSVGSGSTREWAFRII